MTRSTQLSAGASIYRCWIAAAVFAGHLYISGNLAKAEDTTIDLPALVKECCTTSSYRNGDPRSLNLTSPMRLTFLTYLKDYALTFHRPPLSFFQEIGALTGINFTINPMMYDTKPFASLLTVTALPAHRSEISSEDLSDLQSRFQGLSGVTFANEIKGIDGVLAELYGRDTNQIAAFRSVSSEQKIKVSAIFVKPKNNEDIEVMIERGVLQGFGFDADGRFLSGSIFAQDGTDMTEQDESALKWLYDK